MTGWALVHWDMRGHLIGLERYRFKYKAEREARQRMQRPFNRQHDIWFVMPWRFRPRPERGGTTAEGDETGDMSTNPTK